MADGRPDPPPEISRRGFLERSAALGAGVGALRLSGAPVAAIFERAAADPLTASCTVRDGTITIGNAAVSGAWDARNGMFITRQITDRINGRELHPAPAAFSLAIGDTDHIAADTMRIVSGPRAERLAARPQASRLAERSAGWQAVLTLRDKDDRVEATWRVVLRDGSRYLRQEVSLSALRAPLSVRSITMVDLALPGAEVIGQVQGSPVVSDGSYAALEHPLSTSTAAGGKAQCTLARELPLRPGAPFTVSAVAGSTRKRQLRRDFLAYVERERAHPYRTFLHYNSWYDLGYFSKYNEPDALAVIAAFGSELREKRNVVLDFVPVRRWLG